LLKDVHRFCDDPGIARMLRNLTSLLRGRPHTLVLGCGSWTPPPDLEKPSPCSTCRFRKSRN
jgi:hypothetical protein